MISNAYEDNAAMNTRIQLFSKLLFILLLSFQFTHAMANTGTAVNIEGSALINGSALFTDDVIKAGDVIKTGANSSVAILMEDETILGIGENTSFKVTEYSFNAAKPAESKVSFSLLTGTFRYISGLIAKSNPENIKVTAGTATIGIRGTSFSMTYDGTTRVISVAVVDGEIFVTSGDVTIQIIEGDILKGTLEDIAAGNALPSSLTEDEKADLDFLFNDLENKALGTFATNAYGDTSGTRVSGAGGGDTGCTASPTQPCP